MKIFYFLVASYLTANSYGDWIDITGNLPAEYNVLTNGYITVDGPQRSNTPLDQIFAFENTLILSTVSDVYLSTDNGQSFQETNVPFSLSTNSFVLPSTRRNLQIEGGVLSVFGNIFVNGFFDRAVYSLNPETAVWGTKMILIPELDAAAYGGVQHYSSGGPGSNYYALTSKQIMGPDFPSDLSDISYNSYLWASTDGQIWERITPIEHPFGYVDQFFEFDEDLYLHTEGKILKSENQGQNWQTTFNLNASHQPQFQYSLSLNGDDYFTRASDANRTVFIDPDYGIGRHLALIDPTTASASYHWFPVGITQVSKQQSMLFVTGESFLEEGELLNQDLIYYSATGGKSWDPLDLSGLETIFLSQDNPFMILPNFQRISGFAIGTNYAYAVSNNQRLWRRPLSELSFEPSTHIFQQPENHIVEIGSNAQLEVAAVGAGGLSYQWTKDSVALPETNSPTLTIESVSESTVGNYVVTVTGDRGTATSRMARVDLAATFETFALAHFPVDKRKLEDDANNNGLSNFEEYIYLIGDHDRAKLPNFRIQSGAELGLFYRDGSYYLTIQIRKNIAAIDYDFQAVAAQQLGALSSGFDNAVEVGEPLIEDGVSIHTFRSAFDLQSSDQGFMQILFEKID